MASNTLTGNSLASTYLQLLHIGLGTAGICTLRTGDGTATALSLVSGGAKVTGTLEVTSNLVVGGTLAITGQLTALGVPEFKRLTADVVAATTTQVAITSFNFVPVSGAVYHIEMDLIGYSVSTTTGLRLINTGGAGSLILAAPDIGISLDAIGGAYAATASPVASSNFGIRLAGIFAPSSAAALSFSLYSEIAASAVTLKAGSILKITRIS